jgi:hypothetical protein
MSKAGKGTLIANMVAIFQVIAAIAACYLLVEVWLYFK